MRHNRETFHRRQIKNDRLVFQPVILLIIQLILQDREVCDFLDVDPAFVLLSPFTDERLVRQHGLAPFEVGSQNGTDLQCEGVLPVLSVVGDVAFDLLVDNYT